MCDYFAQERTSAVQVFRREPSAKTPRTGTAAHAPLTHHLPLPDGFYSRRLQISTSKRLRKRFDA
jgi:hypothetical protein